MPFKEGNQRSAYMRRYRKRNKLLNIPDLQPFLNAIQGCATCKASPVVFLTEEEIPLCEEHWSILAESGICFGEEKEEIGVIRPSEPIDYSEVVEVLSPMGQKGFISKEAYEKEKNGENVWHILARK